jgi:N-acetylmuramic acid 6-phosphate etherase
MSSTERVHPRGRLIGPGSSTREVVDLLHQEDRRAVRAAGRVRGAIARGAEMIAQALMAGGRLVYVGAGTSGRLGALDAAECPPTFGTSAAQVVALIAGGPRALTEAIEGAEDRVVDARRALRAAKVGAIDVVCGISASGRTPWVLAALAEARKRGATTMLVSCNPAAARRVRVDLRICPNTQAEVLAGSTRLKAGTATKIVLNALTTAAMIRLGRVEAGRMIGLRPTNRKLQARAVRIVADLLGIDRAEAARRLEREGIEGALREAPRLPLG